MVDTVLQFEGDQQYMYRILRSMKNRFGSTSEIGIYEMLQSGLRQVTNPSELLLSNHDQELSGIAVSATVEGVRPILLEVQSLVSTAAYGVPQRSATGFDSRRLNMLLAVLEKRVGFKLAAKDVFLNIAGGIRVSDPALDLAVVMAVLSSNIDAALPADTVFAGEVGLSGEIRAVSRIEQRISEAEKLGFKRIFVPLGNKKGFTCGINRTAINRIVSGINNIASQKFSDARRGNGEAENVGEGLSLKELSHKKYPLIIIYTFTATMQHASNSQATISCTDKGAVRSGNSPPLPR